MRERLSANEAVAADLVAKDVAAEQSTAVKADAAEQFKTGKPCKLQ